MGGGGGHNVQGWGAQTEKIRHIIIFVKMPSLLIIKKCRYEIMKISAISKFRATVELPLSLKRMDEPITHNFK